jgi:acyl dehydratase
VDPDGRLLSRDFDALEAGLTFGSRARTITEADIVGFSALTGDWHPQHSDAVWAAESEFGERVAHGMLVLSVAVGLVELDPDGVVALRRIRTATFKAPVAIGDTIRAEGTVARLRTVDRATGLVETRWRVVNQDGVLVASLSLEILWRRATAGDRRMREAIA